MALENLVINFIGTRVHRVGHVVCHLKGVDDTSGLRIINTVARGKVLIRVHRDNERSLMTISPFL